MKSTVHQYRRWFEYEKDAHTKVLASLETVPGARRESAEFSKTLELFAHIIAARWLWLHRMGVEEKGPDALFPGGVGVKELASKCDEMQRTWTSYLEGLDDGDLSREFEYTSYEGDRYRNRIEDILAQLFGHSWYHRGQIASLVKALGGKPAPTDLVYWTRERID